MEARKAIVKANALWIDAGNHFDSGQVIIGNTYHRGDYFGAENATIQGIESCRITGLRHACLPPAGLSSTT